MSPLRYAWKRLAAIVLLGLLLIGAVIGAVFWQLGGTVTPEQWAATHTTAPCTHPLNTANTPCER